MTDEQAIEYLQSIAITAVKLQVHVAELYPGELEDIGQMDQDLNDLLDWHKEHGDNSDEDPTKFPYQEG